MPQSPGVIRPKLGCYVIPACIKRESSLQNQWIPAFAGMTKTETYLNQPLITEGLLMSGLFVLRLPTICPNLFHFVFFLLPLLL